MANTRSEKRMANTAIFAIAFTFANPFVSAQSPTVGWTRVADGIEHAHIVRPAPSDGSWNVNALRLDLSRVRVDVVRARDVAIGVEPVSSIAARVGALAAVNGGYFRTSGDFLGDSTGTLQIDGDIWSEPDRARASVGIVRRRSSQRLIFGHVVWRATIQIGRVSRALDGINRLRGANEIVLFTRHFGPAAVTDASGLELLVRDDRIVEIQDGVGRASIPADGFVVSARGEGADWLRRRARKGERVTVSTTLRAADSSSANDWVDAEDVLGAGPSVVRNGRVDITDEREKVVPTFRATTHPRTAIASLADGKALLLVADGRHPPQRVGLSLDDLARLLIELGARDAINLDGGGSTTMVVNGSIVNFPSDASGERPVSDAITVRKR